MPVVHLDNAIECLRQYNRKINLRGFSGVLVLDIFGCGFAGGLVHLIPKRYKEELSLMTHYVDSHTFEQWSKLTLVCYKERSRQKFLGTSWPSVCLKVGKSS